MLSNQPQNFIGLGGDTVSLNHADYMAFVSHVKRTAHASLADNGLLISTQLDSFFKSNHVIKHMETLLCYKSLKL